MGARVTLDLKCNGIRGGYGRSCPSVGQYYGPTQAAAELAADLDGWVIEDPDHVYCKNCTRPIPAWARYENVFKKSED